MGKNVKRKYEPLAFYNKAGIETRLSEMAAEGWFIEEMGLLWKYKKGRPSKRTYSVVYVKESDTPEEETKLAEFVEECSAEGWKLCLADRGMNIFYREGGNRGCIKTDAASELEYIHSKMKADNSKNPLSTVLLAAMYVFQLVSQWKNQPLDALASSLNIAFIVFILMAAINLIEIFTYYRWRRKALRKVRDDNSLLRVKDNKVLHGMADGSLAAVLISLLFAAIADRVYWAIAGLAILLFFLWFIGRQKKANSRKRLAENAAKEKKDFEIKQPWGLLIVFGGGFAICIAVVFLSQFNFGAVFKSEAEKAPLCYEDFYPNGVYEVSFDDYDVKESLLIKSEYFTEDIELAEETKQEEYIYLEYQYVEVKVKELYDFAFRQLLKQEYKRLADYKAIGCKDFDAKEIYKRESEYIILWDDAFARFDVERELSDAELEMVIDKLRKRQ